MQYLSCFFICLFSLIAFAACGGDTKQTQSNLNNFTGEETAYAKTHYGESASVLAKGDLLGNGKLTALTGIVRQKSNTGYWIEKASFVQKEDKDWKVLLKMEERLSSTKGELVSQVDAKNGYLIRIDTAAKPLVISIVMADEYGKAASDDAQIIWNGKTLAFEFKSPIEEIPQ